MGLVTITPNEKASNRTKNRIRENGPVFNKKDTITSHPSFGHTAAVYVVSKSTDWFGWFPVSEVTIEEISDAANRDAG